MATERKLRPYKMTPPIRVRANKTLIHSDGTESFTKGRIYQALIAVVLTEHTKVYDNQDDLHVLGDWHKHFTVVKLNRVFTSVEVSECCGAKVIGESDELGVCTKCKEHCEYVSDTEE